MEHLASLWTDFHKILYLCIFVHAVVKIQVAFRCDKMADTLHEDVCIFMIISR